MRRSTRPPWKNCRWSLILANNQYAYSTPTTRQFACRDLADKAVGYGVEVQSVDGTDLAACLKIVGDAVARAREGRGPQLVVATCSAFAATANTTTPATLTPN
jgi:TPP-dependent pyruvate/acetoin dehydrogenase alpha subunit